ncbi:MAG: hypothetical protein JNJ54_08365 [Myxococcaceae bacterium]|nr:hypothetical protein [Myxococcaceae bacterium]
MSALLLAVVLAQAEVPPDAAGAWADPARSAFLVPGARALLSGFSPVSFDGLQPAASAVRYDGVLLRLPAHGFLGPTALPASWLDGVQVGRAADGVEVARSLGRELTLMAKKPAAGWHAAARVDVLATGLSVSGELPGTGTGVQAAARFFTLPAVAASFLRVRALLGDWQLRVVQPVAGSEVRVLALGAADDAALTVSGIPLSARVVSQLVDVRWMSGALETGLTASHDSLALGIRGAQTRNDLVGGEQVLTARGAWRPVVAGQVRLAVGADASARRVVLARTSESALPPLPGLDPSVVTASTRRDLGTAVVGGAFFEASDTQGPFRWRAGLRGDLWRTLEGTVLWSLDPRLSVERDFGDTFTLLASAGLRHQPATWLVPVPVLDTSSWRWGLQQAVVADLAARVAPATKHRLEARVFGTSLRRSVELSPFDDTFLPEVNQSAEDLARRSGPGFAAGGSIAWSYTPSETLWLRASYSLVSSWRTATITRSGVDGLATSETSGLVPWAFDQTHLLQGASGWRFGNGWALGATLTLQSGAPLIGGLYGQEQREGLDSIRRTPRWVPVDRDLVGRASPWLRVDGRFSKTWRPTPLELELFLDVQNLSVWAQPTGLTYGTAPATLGEQARGEVTLTSRPASSPLGFPIPVLGLEARL